jgi:hypothetical protein
VSIASSLVAAWACSLFCGSCFVLVRSFSLGAWRFVVWLLVVRSAVGPGRLKAVLRLYVFVCPRPATTLALVDWRPLRRVLCLASVFACRLKPLWVHFSPMVHL